MRIHIDTDHPGQAAWQLTDKLEAETGHWIVQSWGKEGFVAGKLGTRFGNALSKYGCDEGICGVYRCGELPALKEVKEDLRIGRRDYLAVYGEADELGHEVQDRRSAKESTFVPLKDIAYDALAKSDGLTTLSLAKAIRTSRSAACRALQDLLTEKRVRVVNLLPSKSPRGGVKTRVFGVAA